MSFEDNFKNQDNSLNSISSSDYLYIHFNGISFSNLHELKKNPFKVIIDHININSVRNKFEPPRQMVKDNINILLVSEAKSDYRFPVGQFCIDGYSIPYRLDRTSHSGRILLYIREDIPSKMLKFEQVQSNFEGFFDEIILSKKKWLLSCLYYPNRKKYCKACEKYRIGLDQLNAMITY